MRYTLLPIFMVMFVGNAVCNSDNKLQLPHFAVTDSAGKQSSYLIPYYGDDTSKPLRVDKYSNSNKLEEIRIYSDHFLIILDSDGVLKERRRYTEKDFFSNWAWSGQVQLDKEAEQDAAANP